MTGGEDTAKPWRESHSGTEQDSTCTLRPDEPRVYKTATWRHIALGSCGIDFFGIDTQFRKALDRSLGVELAVASQT